jgi:hypothetical protein
MEASEEASSVSGALPSEHNIAGSVWVAQAGCEGSAGSKVAAHAVCPTTRSGRRGAKLQTLGRRGIRAGMIMWVGMGRQGLHFNKSTQRIGFLPRCETQPSL